MSIQIEEELNWSALDAEAVHAAIANSSPANYFDLCQSWYHVSSQCPFNLRQDSTFQGNNHPLYGAGKSLSSSLPLVKDKASAFYKVKEICVQL